jgi:hypothetical protein
MPKALDCDVQETIIGKVPVAQADASKLCCHCALVAEKIGLMNVNQVAIQLSHVNVNQFCHSNTKPYLARLAFPGPGRCTSKQPKYEGNIIE